MARMEMTKAINHGKQKGFIQTQGALVTMIALLAAGCATTHHAPVPKTKAQQQAITPTQALEKLATGNARFVAGKTWIRQWPEQRTATTAGQYPFAVVLSCIDSRASSEIIFDQGLGDIFNARVAGNVLDDAILGSLEFATKIAGAKLIAVVGHSHCGAVKGACSGAQLGHLTSLLAHIQPAVDEAKAKRPGVPVTDPKFIEQVAELNVQLVQQRIRAQSPVLRELIDSGQIALVGGIYDLDSGKVQFFNH
jgi:carbonic anhydrase